MEEKIKKPRIKTRSSISKNNRTKGHQMERDIVNELKDIGYKFAATSRQVSRILDDAKVDIYGVPFNIQSKNSEATIKYKELLEEVNAEITKKVPRRLQYPTVIFHKKERTTLVVMSKSDFYEIIKCLLNKDVEVL